MRRPAFLLPLLVAALALGGCSDDDEAVTPPAATAPADTGMTETTDTTMSGAMELKAKVGSEDDPEAFQIHLRDADGNDVTSLPPGQYTIKVEDHADTHNFHLTGPGVDEMTSVEGTEEVEWQVTLAAGDYTFLCDPHPTEMRGGFNVG